MSDTLGEFCHLAVTFLFLTCPKFQGDPATWQFVQKNFPNVRLITVCQLAVKFQK
jgi:hypothetical protein